MIIFSQSVGQEVFVFPKYVDKALSPTRQLSINMLKTDLPEENDAAQK